MSREMAVNSHGCISCVKGSLDVSLARTNGGGIHRRVTGSFCLLEITNEVYCMTYAHFHHDCRYRCHFPCQLVWNNGNGVGIRTVYRGLQIGKSSCVSCQCLLSFMVWLGLLPVCQTVGILFNC